MRGGGRAHWVFLLFEHNQHELDEAKLRARSLGFSEFIVKRSKRFLGRERLKLAWSEGRSVRPPSDSAARNPALVEFEAAEERGERIAEILSRVEIDCRAKRLGELYVSAAGEAYPCCWLASGVYPADSEHGANQLREYLEQSGGRATLNLRAKQISDVVQGRFFLRIEESWRGADRPLTCARICGAGVESFDRQFEHHALEVSSAEAPLIIF